MQKLSPISTERVNTCDPRLIRVVNRFLTLVNFPVMVTCGWRSQAEQDENFRKGVTKVKFSKHQHKPSKAIDIAPLTKGALIDWKYSPQFYIMAGFFLAAAVLEGVKIRWGGDWNSDGYAKDNTFNDLVHFELVD